MQIARECCYEFANEEPTELMDNIIESTIGKFDKFFVSSASAQRELLEFFASLGITELSFDRFRTAFLED